MAKSPNLIDLIERFPTPAAARAHLESILWPDGPVCPHCGVVNEATRLGGKAGALGQWKCRPCRKKFTVTVGTIYEDSHIPLHKWLIAFHLMCANKKGISALSLSRMLGITYKCAWHMAHRIRLSMEDRLETEQLTGVVEVDETYIGGIARNAHKSKGTPLKTPVLALVQRGGKVKTHALTTVDEHNIGPILQEKIAKGALLMTDGADVYGLHIKRNPHYFSEHMNVKHSLGEYVREEPDGFVAHTNTVESFNSLVKRCIIGAWHAISPEHLDRYVGEVSFRWNTKSVSDGERTEAAIRQTAGRRLMYKALANAA